MEYNAVPFGSLGIMTLLTTGLCQIIITSAGYIIPVAVGATIGTVVTGVKIIVLGDPPKRAITTALGSSTSAGATTAAMLSKTTADVISGALVSCLSASAFAAIIAGMTGMKDNISFRSVGLLAVGTNVSGDHATYDCWKNVIHEECRKPSNGMLLKDLALHQNVSKVTVSDTCFLPHIFIENVWKEKFEIEYLLTRNGLSCHARLLAAST